MSLMADEIAEIPQAVARLADQGGAAIREAAAAARAFDPALIATVARGSSDHACTYLKYAAEIALGLPVASVGPSIASVYGAELRMGRALCLGVSQSGRSPDIVALLRAAQAGGALSVAISNHADSPLVSAAAHGIALHAGPERSVAATKTFVTSAVAGLSLLAEWKDDTALRSAIAALPEALERAVAIDWPDFRATAEAADNLFVIGRGPSWAMAGEAALKFKETCQIHAEAYSAAELQHGPVSIVGAGFPVLALAAADAAEQGVAEAADALAAKGARVLVTSDRAGQASRLPCARTGHPLTDPLALITTFYAAAERIARARGIDPDKPRHLSKVTETL